jgi:hypothetical protein
MLRSMFARVGTAAGLVALAACSSPPPRVLISEIHYHPAAEDDYVERHEFVELYNASDAAVGLGGWRLVGDKVAFELPDVTIAPGGYQVIARDRAALAVVWGLDPAAVIGDYTGELDNGRDTIRLLDGSGDEADAVTYRDEFPWPVAADGLGAGDKWIAPELAPVEAHRYRGYSLERISAELPSDDPASWALSPLDGSTPGLANAAAAPVAPAIAVARSLGPGADPSQLVAVVELSAGGAIGGVELEWFVDDLALDGGEPVTATAMTEAAPRQYTAAIPAVGDGVIVRYRVVGDRGAGAGREVVSPRPTDPYRWHAYAATPAVAGGGRAYHVYVAPAAWGQMWNNIAGGQGSGCSLNPTWDAEVPVVVLYEGGVYDALARYQGSRYNRTNGRPIPSWPYPGPTAGPNPPSVLSWHLSFPRYHKLDGKGDIILGKNNQGCPGLDAGVGFALFRANGLPASDASYAQLYVNGGYYHYMLEIERPGDEMMAKYGEVGDLFKSVGSVEDNPIGWGDERVLGDVCGFTAAQRYELTYDRKTHTGWGRQDELIRMITDLDAARAGGVDAMRGFFAERFDVDALLTEMAIMNWAVPFDDMFQNHFLYLRRDGRWMAMPWDLDLDFGGWKGANASLWIGEQGDPDNRDGWWNVLKDAFIKSHRAELGARMRELVDTTLSPEAVGPMIDAWMAGVDADASGSAPAGPACDFGARAVSWRQFVVDRQAVVRAAVPAP